MGVLSFLAISGHLKVGWEPHFVIFLAGTVLTALTIPISLYGILQHLQHIDLPDVQRHVCRVLWLVPIYAADSWLALVFGVFCVPRYSIYVDAIRETYEAYTIYSFTMFLVKYIEHHQERGIVEVLKAKSYKLDHFFPFNYFLPAMNMDELFFINIMIGVLNYVVVKPVTTALTVAMQLVGWYDLGSFRLSRGYIYILMIDNASCLWALYCLILLYHAVHDEIKDIRPLWKFLCVKGVVFATFWQSSLLSVLSYFGVIRAFAGDWRCYDSSSEVVAALDDFLVCFEMLFFAILHVVAFPAREFRLLPLEQLAASSAGSASAPKHRFSSKVAYLFDVSDVVQDVSSSMRHVLRRGSGTGLPSADAAAEEAEAEAATAEGSELRQPLLARDDASSSNPVT